ncbi:hypothetical protein NDU88_002256 [Pleurodeles waltl]|uniref:Uncharacterized protein n=1 Tax=Pleurodeles waltl TaxID=8319 RepID=A0AAV7WKQ3_PLEWA|nr:hypothetical protein NDU88_002256 [Pleurodeles waltl]
MFLNSELSMTAAGVVCVPLVDGCAGAGAMLGEGGAGAAVSGPGVDDVEGPARVAVILGATWVGVVVLVVAAGHGWAPLGKCPPDPCGSLMAITPYHVAETRLHIQNVAVTHRPPLEFSVLIGIHIVSCKK